MCAGSRNVLRSSERRTFRVRPSALMGCTVYVLKSLQDQKLYIGMTDNLERRFEEHNRGKVPSTKNRKPFVLLHSEIFSNREEAAKREIFLKSGAGHKFLKDKLTLNNIENVENYIIHISSYPIFRLIVLP